MASLCCSLAIACSSRAGVGRASADSRRSRRRSKWWSVVGCTSWKMTVLPKSGAISSCRVTFEKPYRSMEGPGSVEWQKINVVVGESTV
jgi:hypothetical protein